MDPALPRLADVPGPIRGLVPPDARIEIPAQGETSTVVFAIGGQRTVVLKRCVGTVEAALLAREHANLQALAATDLPIPKALGFVECTDREEPQAWLATTLIPGRSLVAVLGECTDPCDRAEWFRRAGAMLAQIHATPIPGDLCGRSGTPWLDRMRRRAQRDGERWPRRSRALLEQLEREHAPSGPETLIHGDFTLDNVLAEDDRVTGVIDWGGAGHGDPRYDLALALATGPAGDPATDEVAAFLAGYRSGPLPPEIRASTFSVDGL